MVSPDKHFTSVWSSRRIHVGWQSQPLAKQKTSLGGNAEQLAFAHGSWTHPPEQKRRSAAPLSWHWLATLPLYINRATSLPHFRKTSQWACGAASQVKFPHGLVSPVSSGTQPRFLFLTYPSQHFVVWITTACPPGPLKIKIYIFLLALQLASYSPDSYVDWLTTLISRF